MTVGMSRGTGDKLKSPSERRAAPAAVAADGEGPPAHLRRLGARLGRLCIALSGLIGAVALAGWATGSARLTSVLPAFPAMVPNTALALCLASAAWWLLAAQGRPRARIRAGELAAALVTGIGALTVLEYAIGPLGVDQLLFTVPESFVRHPGRPALPTAVAIAAAGASLLLLRVRSSRSIQPSDYAAAITGVMGLAGLASYVFGVAPVYGIPGEPAEPAMALPTALALLLLCAALVLARPSAGLAALLLGRYMGGVVIRRMLVSVIIFPAFGLVIVGGFRSGLYEAEVAAAAIMTGGLVIGSLVAIITGLKLDKLDRARRLATFEQARLAAIVESSSDAIMSATPEGVGLTWNRAAEHIYGYSAAEILGDPRTAMRVVPPERRGEVAELLARIRRGERVTGHVTERVRKDGQRFHASLTLSPMLGEGGEVIGISTIVRDITPRVCAERALRESEVRYRQLFEQAADGVFVADLTGTYTDVNGAGCALLGYSRDEILGKTIMDLIPPEDVPRLAAARERLLQGSVDVDEWRLRRKDGAFVPVEVSAKILPNGVWQGLVRDISDRKEAEAKLQQAYATEQRLRKQIEAIYEQEAIKRAWLQTVIDQLPEGVIVLDAAGAVAAINAAALGLASSPEPRTDPWGNAYRFDVRRTTGEPLPFDELPLARAFQYHEVIQGQELQIRTAGGETVPIVASAAPVRDEAGALLGAALVMQDITVLKELERRREEWISVIAHDLRQPLGVIRLSAALLQRSALPERDRKHVERVHNATVRLEAMINDLLDASRLEANRLQLHKEPEELPALLERILEHLAPVISGHHVAVTREGALRPVLVDSNRVEQVLGNLLSNAVKYGEPGTDIQIALEDQGEAALVSVINRGRGIPAGEIGTLFSRFKRTSTSAGVTGIGLGLYICKGLVEAHGGRIGVQSAPGALTRFHFTLPYAPACALAG